jgi:hypothetical protein
MDFIGQAGPTSRVHLILLDILTVVLQLTHMAAYMLRSRLKEPGSSSTADGASATAPTQPPPAAQQNLDAEERGVIRSDEQQDIEMQTLNPSGTTTDPSVAADTTEETSDRSALLDPISPLTDAHIFDAFHSGQIVIADLDMRKRINEQIHLAKTYRADQQSSGLQTMRFALANRVLRMRMGADALRQNI